VRSEAHTDDRENETRIANCCPTFYQFLIIDERVSIEASHKLERHATVRKEMDLPDSWLSSLETEDLPAILALVPPATAIIVPISFVVGTLEWHARYFDVVTG
jgi:hypothetical protein